VSAENGTAEALATLLAVVAADRDARCREIRVPAEAAAAARLTEAAASTRRELRRALVGEREALRAQLASARTRRDAALHERRQRLAQGALDEGWTMLAPALGRLWRHPARRERWIAATLVAAHARLSPGPWTVRHPPGLAPEELEAMRGEFAARGVGDIRCEADPRIEAGIEIRAGNARLDATVAGLLADRAAVAGRLLYFWEEAASSDEASAATQALALRPDAEDGGPVSGGDEAEPPSRPAPE